jgi:FxLD family lantipeptide
METVVMGATVLGEEFDLDVRVITDARPEVAVGCNTDNGCQSTCRSACVSGSAG